jgi:DNA-binding NarL/FixJ family response regulator
MLAARTTILLIDAHDGVRSALGGRLRALDDFDIVADTSSTTRGLDIAARLRPALIIVDFGTATPYAAALCGRMHQASPGSLLVAFTSFADDETRRQYIEAGVNACLVKDIGFAGLVRELRELLVNQR